MSHDLEHQIRVLYLLIEWRLHAEIKHPDWFKTKTSHMTCNTQSECNYSTLKMFMTAYWSQCHKPRFKVGCLVMWHVWTKFECFISELCLLLLNLLTTLALVLASSMHLGAIQQLSRHECRRQRNTKIKSMVEESN